MRLESLEERRVLASVPIVNPSFEADVLGDGGFNNFVTGWSTSGATGTFNPTSAHIGPQATDGANVVYSTSGTVSQVLGTNQAANTVYTLQVDIGERNDSAPAGTYAVELWAGGVLLGSATQLNTPQVNNGFVTATVTFVSRFSGGALEIRLISGSPQVLFDNVRLDASTSAAIDDPATNVRVPLQNATAILSQGGFDVGNTIDADSTGTGWANSAQANNTAVWETAHDLNPTGASIPLTFTMYSGGFGTHTLGRFRISATTDNRATFANGLANGGAVAANWTVLAPLAVSSATPGVVFTVLGDNSILVSGTNPEFDTYTIQATTNLANITGFRLEAIEDPSFASNGPGRAGNGNFVVYDFAAFVGAPAVTLQTPTAFFSQGGFPVANLVDGNLGTGWANSGNGLGNNAAVFETSANLNPAGQPMLLSFTLYTGGFGVHTLGKLRFSVTSDNRATFADGLANGGDVAAAWTIATPVAVTGTKATLTIQGDGSVLASGPIDEFETYQVTVLTTQANITGIRLEALTDPSLPFNGPGRAAGNGNFVVYELRMTANTNVVVTNADAALPVVHVLANDLIVDGGAESISAIDTSGTLGAVAINPGALSVSYDPTAVPAFAALTPGQTAIDRFRYTLLVGGNAEPATVTVVVLGVNDLPVAAPDGFPAYPSFTTDEDTALNISLIAPVIPYQVPAAQAGNQAFGGSLGMDFNVNRPILVTHLGVFDDGSNGLNLPLTARLWQRTGPASGALLATIPFATGATGTLIGGSRFLPLATPLLLPAGFQGRIVGEGYGVGELNGNSGGAAPPWTTDTGAGALSFLGGGFYGTAGLYPTGGDGGPANRYAAGTFRFVEPSSLLQNDTDVDAGQSVSAVAEVVLSAQGATVTINADGTFSYDPTSSPALQALAVGEFVDDTFTYQATDGIATVPGTVTIRTTGANDAPVAVAGTYTINEGEDLVLDGSASFDVDTSQTPLLQYFWDLDNDTVTDFVGIGPTIPWASLIALGINDGGPLGTDYTITLTVEDSNGVQHTTTGTVTVNNVEPTIVVTGPTSGVIGAPLFFTIEIVDPSPVDQNALADVHIEFDSLDWDPVSFDGQMTPALTPAVIPQSFSPLTLGQHTLLATVTDQDGGVSATASLVIDVGLVYQDPVTGDVYAGGLDGAADRIVFYNGNGGRVLVRVENFLTAGTIPAVPRVYGPFTPLPGSRLIAYGNGGADTITVANLLLPAEFHGGADNDYLAGGSLDDSLFGDGGQDRLLGGNGNDYLDGGDDNDSIDAAAGDDTLLGGGGIDTMIGGAGNDLLLGGDGADKMSGGDGDDILFGEAGLDTLNGGRGNDVLHGGSDNDRLLGDVGRDILIGGLGVDNVNGGGDDDVLIGGTTAYDDPTIAANIAALSALSSEWAFLGRTYAQRVNNLRTGGGLTLGNTLAPGSSVTLNDGAIDTLSGSTGTDWFLAAVSAGQIDRTDRVAGETLN